ncbi:MAG TPA: tetratricopeptide repeat protein [Chitinophagaceae bacterium]|nr:tetratricopeptide repeat protein [Chitinophagaceae bacterium]
MIIKLFSKPFLTLFALFIVFTSSLSVKTYSQSSPESYQLQKEGHKQIQNNNPEQAIILFKQAIRIDPQEVSLRRDLSYAYFLTGDLKEAKNGIKDVLNSSFADEQTFRIAAAIENADGNTRRANRIIRDGLQKYPYSGLLYQQQGVLYQFQKKEKNALEAWQKGIEVDPNFATNYYFAALAYAKKQEHIWAVIYGEIYLNMENHPNRGFEIKKQIVESYQELFKQDNLSDLPTFGKNNQNSEHNFSNILEFLTLQNGGILKRGFDIEALIMLRTRVLLDWKNNYSINYPSSLLSYHQRLMNNGFFDTYNQWLFGAYLNSQEFSTWKQMHSNIFAKFEDWKNKNPLQMASFDPKP